MDWQKHLQNLINTPYTGAYPDQRFALLLFSSLLMVALITLLIKKYSRFLLPKYAQEATVSSALQNEMMRSFVEGEEPKDGNAETLPKNLVDESEFRLLNNKTIPGLVGVHIDNDIATIVEVTCKTEAVMKDERFHELVDLVARACIKNASPYAPCNTLKDIRKICMDMCQIPAIKAPDGTLLSEVAANYSSIIREQVTLRSSVCFKAIPGIQLCGYTYPANKSKDSTKLGIFGGIAAIKQSAEEPLSPNISELAEKICQLMSNVDLTKIVENNDPCLEWMVSYPKPDSDEKVKEALMTNKLEILDVARFQCRKCYCIDDEDIEEKVEDELLTRKEE